MNNQRRSMSRRDASLERQLLAAGRAEVPEEAALRRTALMLGLSGTAVSLTVAAGSTAATVSAKASAGAASAGVLTNTAAVASATTPAFAVGFLKAALVGFALGATAIGTAEVARYHLAPSQDGTESAAVRSVAKQRAAERLLSSQEAADVASQQEKTAAPVDSVATFQIDRPQREAPYEPLQTRIGASRRSPVRRETVALPEAAVARDVSDKKTLAVASFDAPAASTKPGETATALSAEIESLDRARAALERGNAALALRELEQFERVRPYGSLGKEVILVRIDALRGLGRNADAALLARRLLAQGAPAPQRARLEQIARAR